MELAKLPDNSVHAESTVLEKTVHGTLKHAGFDARWQDKLMFKGDTSERPALVPDVTCRLAYDEGPKLEYIYDNGVEKWKTDIVDPVKAKYPKSS